MATRKRRNRNRKSKGPSVAVPPPLVVLLVMGAVLALSYLTLCGRCEALGQRIKDWQTEKDDLSQLVAAEEYRLTNMKSPANIERLLRTHNLDQMTYPDPARIIRIPASALRAVSQDPERLAAQYAHRPPGERND